MRGIEVSRTKRGENYFAAYAIIKESRTLKVPIDEK
jgi:hypothetical protein